MTALPRTATPRDIATAWTTLAIRLAAAGNHALAAWALDRATDFYNASLSWRNVAPVNCRVRGVA